MEIKPLSSNIVHICELMMHRLTNKSARSRTTVQCPRGRNKVICYKFLLNLTHSTTEGVTVNDWAGAGG